MTTRSDDIAFHERIRRRREARGMPAYALAERVGVSPSYISLIERGSKVPAEEVAEALARALDDDPDLYRAWARLAGSEDLARALSGADRLHRISSSASLRRQLVSGVNLDETSRRAGAPRVEAAGADLIDVPVIEEGADPGPGTAAPRHVVETVALDRRCLPAGRLVRPFAYRVGEEGARRVRGVVEPGDLVVLTSRVKAAVAGRVYAVRARGGIVLASVLLKADSMLLLPAAGGSDFEVLAVAGRREALAALAGDVVLIVRAWGAG